MIFAGGRPALVAVLYFLDREIRVRVAETEYTPYYDMLERLGRPWSMVPSHEANRFTPSIADYLDRPAGTRSLVMLSNPCNPTGVTRRGAELRRLVEAASSSDTGLLIDEAYELFHDHPESALQYAGDIDSSNLFVVGAATKGLQAPGIRIGWVVAAKKHIEILGNFSSFGMGGVSHPSQRYALELLRPDRITLARKAVPVFYRSQRARYGEAFASLGLRLFAVARLLPVLVRSASA
jgi:aspartate/methionine/tyrosine aminotransferase